MTEPADDFEGMGLEDLRDHLQSAEAHAARIRACLAAREREAELAAAQAHVGEVRWIPIYREGGAPRIVAECVTVLRAYEGREFSLGGDWLVLVDLQLGGSSKEALHRVPAKLLYPTEAGALGAQDAGEPAYYYSPRRHA